MKRYLLFGGQNYDPNGGWGDFIADGDDAEEILAHRPLTEWWHIVDTETREIVNEGVTDPRTVIAQLADQLEAMLDPKA